MPEAYPRSWTPFRSCNSGIRRAYLRWTTLLRLSKVFTISSHHNRHHHRHPSPKISKLILLVPRHCRASRRPTRCSDTPGRSSRASVLRWTMNAMIIRYTPAPLIIRPSSRPRCPITSSSHHNRILIITRSIINRSLRIIIKVTSPRNRHPPRQRRLCPPIIGRTHPMGWPSLCPWFTGHHQPLLASPPP